MIGGGWRNHLARPYRRNAWPIWLWVFAAACVIATDAFSVRAVAGGIVLALVVAYQATIFLTTEAALADIRAGWQRGPAGWLYDDLPEPRSYFGYPSRTGWKAAGYLVATGVLPDDYRSVGVEFSVPVWYTFETPRSCYEDTELYLLAQPVTGAATVPEALLSAHYGHVGTVVSEGWPRLQLGQKNAPADDSPAVYDLDAVAPRSDDDGPVSHHDSPPIPPGSYPMWVGLYDPATMERLPIVAADGRPIGDAVELLSVEVGAAP
jgi:hypothetical protein